MDYDSFVLASPTVTSASLWKLADENHSSSQTRPQAQTTNIQAQPITSTPLKPSGSQTQTWAPAQAQPKAPAQAQPQALVQAQPPQLSQVQLPQPQGTVPYLLVRQPPSDYLHDEDRVSMDFPESEAFLIAKQACSELLDRVVTFCSLDRSDAEDQNKALGYRNY